MGEFQTTSYVNVVNSSYPFIGDDHLPGGDQ